MHAVVVSAFGGPEVLTEAELPDPEPGPGQITIDTSHAAVGLIDVLLRRGDMANRSGLPQPPFVPGLEVAGRYANSATASKASTSGNQWSRCLKWHLAGTPA